MNKLQSPSVGVDAVVSAMIGRQVSEMNICIDRIEQYLSENKQVELTKDDKNKISGFVADAMIGAIQSQSH